MATAAKELVLTKSPARRSFPTDPRVPRQVRRAEALLGSVRRRQIAQYFFHAVEHPIATPTADSVHRLVEEAQLFIEAAHSCRLKL